MFTKFFALLAVLTFSFLFSCSDDNGTSNTNTMAVGTFSLKIDGTAWTKTTVMAVKTGFNGMCSITAVNASQQTVGLELEIDSVGSYSSGDGTFMIVNTTDPLQSKSYRNNAFSYNITAVSETEVSGTFSFIATNSQDETDKKNITDGKFRLKFTN